MKYFIVTLIKDLPIVKAGFSFSVSEAVFNDPFSFCGFESQIDGIDDYSFEKMLHSVLEYRNNKEFVKIEFDFSKAIRIQCPNCKNMGMFSYFNNDLTSKYFSDVTYWYQEVGLECPCCDYKLPTHNVLVNKKVDF